MRRETTVTVIGGGLSGLTSALYLAMAGADVTILEQGKEYGERRVENGGEILCGLGGAGTLTGGKLCFPPASGGIWRKTRGQMQDFPAFCRDSFSELHTLQAFPGPEGDYASGRTSRKKYRTALVFGREMNAFVSRLIQSALREGVRIRCGCEVLDVHRASDSCRVSFRSEAGDTETIDSAWAVFAGGRVSTPLLQRVFGADRNHQPDIGLRLTLDRGQPAFSGIGEDVKLKLRLGDYLVRTFCVCCGGSSVMTATRGLIHYDGHFGNELTEQTNLGVLARSPRHAGPEAAERYLRAMQKYVHAGISLKDFQKHHALLAKGTGYEPLFEALAGFLSELRACGMILQNADEIPVLLPAADRMNAVIPTDAGFESRLPGIFVTGDAAGVSRGFVQAMWAGYCAAERIIRRMTCGDRQQAAV